MAFEDVQEGFSSNDHGIVLWIPAEGIADINAPTAAELAAGVRITYGLTPDGYSFTPTQNKITTGRYTLGQELSVDGTTSYALSLTYVYNRDVPTAVEGVLGKRGEAGFIVHALGYLNDHVFAADDKINEIVPVRLSQPVSSAAAANSEPTKVQTPNITGIVAQEVTVAGP